MHCLAATTASLLDHITFSGCRGGGHWAGELIYLPGSLPCTALQRQQLHFWTTSQSPAAGEAPIRLGELVCHPGALQCTALQRQQLHSWTTSQSPAAGEAAIRLGELVCQPGASVHKRLPSRLGVRQLVVTAKEDLGPEATVSFRAQAALPRHKQGPSLHLLREEGLDAWLPLASAEVSGASVVHFLAVQSSPPCSTRCGACVWGSWALHGAGSPCCGHQVCG